MVLSGQVPRWISEGVTFPKVTSWWYSTAIRTTWVPDPINLFSPRSLPRLMGVVLPTKKCWLASVRNTLLPSKVCRTWLETLIFLMWYAGPLTRPISRSLLITNHGFYAIAFSLKTKAPEVRCCQVVLGAMQSWRNDSFTSRARTAVGLNLARIYI